MTGCFVQELWGSEATAPNFAEMRAEVAWAMNQPFRPKPLRLYVYGRDNYDFVRSLGENPILLGEDPSGVYGGRIEADGAIVGGVSIWRNKYDGIRDALTHYPHVVHLDFDSLLTKPLPPDFWQRIAEGPAFKASLQQNFRKHAGHRVVQSWPGKKHATDDARKTPVGAFLYFRGLDVIDRLLRLYDEHPREWDLAVLSRLVDDLMGGWKGAEAYRAMGFEPGCHSLGRHVGRQTFKPKDEDVLFLTTWRKTGLRKHAIRAKKAAEAVA